MKNALIRILQAAGVIIFLCVAARADTPQPLIFAGDADYPPFEYLQDDRPDGFYTDVTAALSRAMNRPVTIRLMDWSQAQQMVLDGRADALIGITISDDRKKLYDFCDTVVHTEFSLFFRKGTAGIPGLDALTGKTVGVTSGGYPRQALAARKTITLKPVDSYAEGFLLLSEGVIDAFAGDKWVGSYSLQKNRTPGITVEEEPFAVLDNTYAVKKGNAALQTDINRGIQLLRDQGEIARIRNKWMRQKMIYTTEERFRMWLLKISLIPLAVLLLCLAVWIVVLKTQIHRRRKTENDLAQSESRYKSMVESMTEGFALHEMIYDEKGLPVDYTFLEANPAFETLTGLAPRDIIGKTAKRVIPGIEEAWIETFAEIVRTGHAQHFELSAQPLSRTYEVFAYRTGPNRFATCFTDITDRKKAQDELKISELRYRQLFKQTSKCVVVFKPAPDTGDFTIVDINEKAEAAENVKRQEVLNRFALQVFPEMKQLGVMDVLKRVCRTGIAENHPISIRQDGRTTAWCDYYIYKLPGDEIVALYEHITERKKMEEDLRQSEEKFAKAFRNAPVLFSIIEADTGRHVDINDEAVRAVGLKREDIIGRTAVDIGWMTKDGYEKLICDLRSRGRLVNRETDFHTRDGRVITGLVGGERIVISGCEYMIFIALDITARKKAEEALAEAENRLQLTIENANIGVCFVGLDGRLVRVNREMAAILGYSRDELLAMTSNDITHPDDRDISPSNIRRALAGQDIKTVFTKRYLRKDGQIAHCRVSSSLIKDASGRPLYFISHVQDVTQQRQMEERLRRAEKMEALGLMAGGVAHDLNNVIGISVGYCEMLQDELPADSALREHVDSIMQATERASAIVQDMLTMARSNVAVNKVLNLNDIVDDFLNSPELASIRAAHPKITIQSDLSPHLLNISGSPLHLMKTIMNLITNAAEAIHGGGVIRITSSNVHLDCPVKGYDAFTAGDYAVLCVSDTGEGISAENLPRIFEPFYTKKVMGRSGTGLGLAVVWGTVKDHQGYIDVASEPGLGATFSLYFPVCREDISQEPAAIDRASYMGKGEYLLVVDDVPEQRELACRLLSKLNYLTASVAGGEEAVEFVKKQSVDLIVLDMIMDPGIDGLDTYRRILEIRPGQKAIIVSGFSHTARVTETQKLGAGPYVKKPFLMETLGTAIRKELDRK